MLNDLPLDAFQKIIIVTGPTDMRKGAERLAMIIQSEFGLDPCAPGVLYVFAGMSKNRIRGIIWEGDGWTMLVKKKLSGRFDWPGGDRQAKRVSREELQKILDGTQTDMTQPEISVSRQTTRKSDDRKKPPKRFYFY